MSTDTQSLAKAPLLRKLWVIVLLTCLILTFPLAMIILLTGDVYRWKEGVFRPIGRGVRLTYGGILALWLVAVILRPILMQSGLSGEWAKTADPAQPTVAASSDQGEPARATQSAPVAPQQEPAAQTEPVTTAPDIKISNQETQYGQALVMTSNDDVPFTIKRVVFNGRAKEKNCDLPDYGLSVESTDMSNEAAQMQAAYGSRLPVSLKRGDRVVFFSACGAATKLDIYTDRGTKHMQSE